MARFRRLAAKVVSVPGAKVREAERARRTEGEHEP